MKIENAIPFIKDIRTHTGLGLAEAKAIFDAIREYDGPVKIGHMALTNSADPSPAPAIGDPADPHFMNRAIEALRRVTGLNHFEARQILEAGFALHLPDAVKNVTPEGQIVPTASCLHCGTWMSKEDEHTIFCDDECFSRYVEGTRVANKTKTVDREIVELERQLAEARARRSAIVDEEYNRTHPF